MSGRVKAYEPPTDAGGTITGSGTTGYIPVFSSSTSIVDSIISQTVDPTTSLVNIAGDLTVQGVSTLNGNLVVTPPNAAVGSSINFQFYGATDTNQTASAEINRFLISSGNRQWTAGAIALQREVYITAPNYSFTSASTITDAYTFFARQPVVGTNATITRKWAAGFDGSVEIEGDLKLKTAGNGIYIKEGSNATMGSISVVFSGAFTVDTVVSTNKVTANSRIILSVESVTDTVGSAVPLAFVLSRSAGASFTIRTTSDVDPNTIVVAWVIIEPS